MNIRTAKKPDCGDIQRIYASAFPAGESGLVSKLAIDLLFDETAPQTLSLVAVIDGSVVGHIAFSPVTIDNNTHLQGYILAPLAVNPDYQKRRIGTKLVDYGLQELSAMGVNVVFVYGDPDYYGRFGFRTDAARQFTAPYKLRYPSGWQAIVLKEFDIERSPVTIACVKSLREPKLW